MYLSKVNDTSYALIKKLIVILMHENNDILKKTFNLSKTTTKTTKIRRKHKHSTNKFTFQNCSDFKQACYNHIWIPSEQRWSISNENAGFKWCTNQMLPWEHPNKGNAEIRMDTNTYLVQNMTLITSTDKHINKYHRTDPNTTGVHVRACVQEIIPVLQSPLVF